jgi:membrane protein implicated in regulation of membrane protease activity
MLNALVVLYFTDQLRLLTALLPLVGRLVFSAEMLGGTLFLIWIIWTKHLPAVGVNTTKPFARAIRFAIQIGLIVFPVTLLANVFGYVNFATHARFQSPIAWTGERPCPLARLPATA